MLVLRDDTGSLLAGASCRRTTRTRWEAAANIQSGNWDAVAEGLAKEDTSAAQLGKWEAGFVRGMERMRRLVCEYYDGFSFGRFVRHHPQFKGHLTDLLIGDLFRDSVDEVFGPMDALREGQEASPH